MSRAANIAYDVIRDRILSGALPPLTHLKEEDLAELCGVSRTPVRDALRRLEADMLVRRTDTQRTYVLELSPEEIEDIFTLRALVEGHACARVAQLITPDQIATLRAHNDAIHVAISRSERLDVQAFVANNVRFHDGILEVLKSDPLMTMRKLLVKQQILHRTARKYDRVGLQRSHQDHEELLLAFTARDSEWARSIMNSHIRHALYVTLSNVKPREADVQGQRAPAHAAPMKAVPIQAAPRKAAPVRAASVQAASMQAASMQAASMQAAPSQAAPVQAASKNSKSKATARLRVVKSV